METSEDPLRLFKALDGFRFWCQPPNSYRNGYPRMTQAWAQKHPGVVPVRLECGQYGNGRGAIQIIGVDTFLPGQPEVLTDKLTVNLIERKIRSDEFFVTTGEFRWADAHAALLRMGLFKVILRSVTVGRMEHYAQKWRFAQGWPYENYLVEDAAVRKMLDDAFIAKEQEILASDAERRLAK